VYVSTDCKTVWHEQCALLHLPSVVAEPETESMTVCSESVAVSCTDQSMNEGDAFSSCTISTDVVPNPDSLATRGLQAYGVRDSSVTAAGSEPYGGKSIVDVIAAIRRARSTASKRRTRKTRRGRRGGVKKQTRRHKVITAILESIVTTVELCELYEELSVADVSAPGGHC